MVVPNNHSPTFEEDQSLVIAQSPIAFVQHVAVSCLRHGYWFYVAGAIPFDKCPADVDEKLCRIYGATASKHIRYRQRQRGECVVQYVRLGRFFLLLARPGRGAFFIFERGQIQDARRRPIRAFGYSIGVRSAKVSVRIDPREYRYWQDRFVRLSLSDRSLLESQFWSLPFEPYRPVRSQILTLWRTVNRLRREASLPELSRECVRWKRCIVSPRQFTVPRS